MEFPKKKPLTLEEKRKKLEELREDWKNAKTDIDRKIIERRAWMIKKSIHQLV